MKIWDCFTFYNELDVLEWRLNELYEHVDKFVLVEATKTFTYQPKALYYENNKQRFAKFADKIVHIVVDDMPAIEREYFGREAFQRNCILRGLDGAEPDDYVIVSDVDELIRAPQLAPALSYLQNRGEVVKLGQGLYYYFINLRCTTHLVWYGPRIAQFKHLGLGKRWLPQTLRINTNDAAAIEDAGWHFSFLGGVDVARDKIAAWSHYEWNRPPFNTVENIAAAIRDGRDWDFERDMKLAWTPVDDTYPRYLLDNLPRFARHISPISPFVESRGR